MLERTGMPYKTKIMRNLWLAAPFAFLSLILAPIAFSQGARFDSVAQRTVQGLIAPIGGATITVCTSGATGTPCSPLVPTSPVTLCTDSTCAVAAPNPFLADSNGNFGFYALPGTYKVSITATGVTGQLITVTLPCVAGTSCVATNTNNAFTGNNTFTSINSRIMADQQAGADACAKINTSLGLVPSTGGVIDARGLQGAQNCGTAVTVSVPALVLLGATNISATACPAIVITSGSATVQGLGRTGANAPANPNSTMITAATGCTGSMVQFNIASGSAGSHLKGLFLNGNSVGTVTNGIEFGPTHQFNKNTVEDVAVAGLPTCLVFDAGGAEDQTIGPGFNCQNVTTGIDVSAAFTSFMGSLRITHSQIVCNSLCLKVGQDDNTAAHTVTGMTVDHTKFVLVANGAGPILIRNAKGFALTDSWIETQPGFTQTQAALIQIGSASSVPQAVTLAGNTIQSNNNAGEYGVELVSGNYHSIERNWFVTQANGTTPVKNTAANTASSVIFNGGFGTAGLPVDSTTGLIEVTGNSTPSSDVLIAGQGLKSTSLQGPVTTLDLDAFNSSNPVRIGRTAMSQLSVFKGDGTLTNVFSIVPTGSGAQINIAGTTSGTATLQAPATGGVTNTLPSLAGTLPVVVANGTATMTTAAITAGNCGTTVTVAAANVATTDTITWAFNAAPAGSNAGLVAWPTSGNVNFAYCSNTAQTPAAATINWRVVR